MRTLLVLAALGWAMSVPWAALFGYIVLTVAAIAILWGLSVLIERHAALPKRDRNIIDHHYVAALESMVAQAEAETETLRAELQRLRAAAASEYDANAALFGRVGLSPAAPEWLVAAARRAYRAALHPDCCDPCDVLQVRLESGPKEGPDHEAIEVYGRADHCRAA